METKLKEAIERLREHLEQPQTALMLTTRDERVRLAAAWTLVGCTRRKPTSIKPEEPPEDLPGLLDWVWKHFEYDLERLARIADVAPSTAEREVKALIEAGIVYPDGKLSGYCAKLVSSRVIDLFPTK